MNSSSTSPPTKSSIGTKFSRDISTPLGAAEVHKSVSTAEDEEAQQEDPAGGMFETDEQASASELRETEVQPEGSARGSLGSNTQVSTPRLPGMETPDHEYFNSILADTGSFTPSGTVQSNFVETESTQSLSGYWVHSDYD
ncbi:hypothetical protein EIP86_000121 [Pleurotus ostreatoroseus]|nr:hypothetical protein EIP86_000121 [Pleurotus ostreatoroseus]